MELGHSAIDAFGRNRTSTLSPSSTSSFSSSSSSFVVPFSLFRGSELSTRGSVPRRTNRFRNYTPTPFPTTSSTHQRLRLHRRAIAPVYSGHDGAAIILHLAGPSYYTYVHLSEAYVCISERQKTRRRFSDFFVCSRKRVSDRSLQASGIIDFAGDPSENTCTPPGPAAKILCVVR